MNLDEAGRQEILTAFKRRRNREYIAAIPLLFAFFLIGYSQDDPGFQILGLRGHGLALGAGVVVAAWLVHYFYNWRCPACSRPFLSGIFITSCPRCGTVFKDR